MEFEQRNKTEEFNNIATGDKKGPLTAVAVDPFSSRLLVEETEDPPPVVATLLIPQEIPSPPDDEMEEQTNENVRCSWCQRPRNVFIVCVIAAAGVVVLATLLYAILSRRNPASAPSNSSPSKAPSFSSSGDLLYDFVALGRWHTCAMTTNEKKLNCWGANNYGQVGDGTTTTRNVPTTIDLGLNVDHAQQISLGYYHSCAVVTTNDNEYELKCWGRNDYGQIGDGTKTDRNIPSTIDLGLNVYVQGMALGGRHTCVTTNRGNRLMCWGQNTYGQLGDGTTTHRSIPTTINLGSYVYDIQLALGWGHTCAIISQISLKCWGSNWGGQLGDGSRTNRSLPTIVDLGLYVKAQQVAAGYAHTCATTNENKLKCWGYNKLGQLGLGTAQTENNPLPTNVDLGGSNVYVDQIALLKGDQTCIITTDDDEIKLLLCWGDNFFGQVGDGTTTHRSIPTTIDLDLGLNASVQQASLGGEHTCAISNDNKLKCWGRNDYGQVGDGTTTDRSTPTLI